MGTQIAPSMGLSRISECSEAGLESALNKKSKRIGREAASTIPQLFLASPGGTSN